MRQGWIGVDLDGTLAHDPGGLSATSPIGDPIPKMVKRVKRWLRQGREVRIFTARITHLENRERQALCDTIEVWCTIHIGEPLSITNMKDMSMVELWDDRAVQVRTNTGERADEPLPEMW